MVSTRLRAALRAFLDDQSGEVGPVTYMFALIPALMMLFFAYDVGLSKGTRLGVEYAAFCAARAAAVQLPKGEETTGGACASAAETAAVRHAAAGCLASVAKKSGVAGRLDFPGSLGPLVDRVEDNIVDLQFQDQGGHAKNCFGHNEVVQVQLTYRHDIYVPLSPLGWGNGRPLDITATAQAMLQTTK